MNNEDEPSREYELCNIMNNNIMSTQIWATMQYSEAIIGKPYIN